MSLNLHPGSRPTLAASLTGASADTLLARLGSLHSAGVVGVELSATGGVDGFHAPALVGAGRDGLVEALQPFRAFAVAAPYQETFDVTLVSPSSAIRRASLAEIWSVCRFAGTVGAERAIRPLVLLRTGMPPVGISSALADGWLVESLASLQHTAEEYRVTLGILSRDRFRRLSDLEELRQLRWASLGIALDTVHLRAMGESWDSIAAFFQEAGDEILYLRVPPSLEAAEALAPVLRATGYTGMVTLSIRGDIPASDTVAAWRSALASSRSGGDEG